MNGSEPVIRLQQVTKQYRAASPQPAFALAPTSIEMFAGTWTIVTGRSGAGKTTLLHLVAGLDRPDTGRILMFGRDITHDSEAALSRIRRTRLGMVYQQFHFIEHLSVWQNVSCRLVPTGLRSRVRRKRAEAVLGELGLSGMADRQPRSLSGGEQQRVALARAVVDKPDVLIADEPTSNVDSVTGELIVHYLKGLQQKGTTIIITTHDSALVSLADHHHVLKGGKLAP